VDKDHFAENFRESRFGPLSGATAFTELRTTIGEFALQIFEDLTAFEDDIRAECLMCYIWARSDLPAY
jgi:hypothetical protein